MKIHEMNLNIRYNDPQEIWDKVELIYQRMEGWLGYGDGKQKGELGIPYWFSFNETEKHILASVEPAGLHFSGLMTIEEWNDWSQQIKILASDILGYKVGEIESGEVDF